MTGFAFVLMGLCSAWIVLGIVAVIRATSRTTRAPKPSELPPVTVLKPLCGADPGLEENLETFFNQDYPSYELLFGVQNPDDPAVALVEALIARHPEVPARLVVHTGADAINPKVDNILGMLPHASNDMLLVSDSNVRAPAHYVSEMVATRLADERTGLVTNLFAGTGEDGLGSAL